MDETSFRQKLCTACLSQAPNNIICNESSIKTKDMARERNLHLIQNRERETQRETEFSKPYKIQREISACHTKYKHRDRYEREFSMQIQNTDKTQRQEV